MELRGTQPDDVFCDKDAYIFSETKNKFSKTTVGNFEKTANFKLKTSLTKILVLTWIQTISVIFLETYFSSENPHKLVNKFCLSDLLLRDYGKFTPDNTCVWHFKALLRNFD